jgi:hypothetical protein
MKQLPLLLLSYQNRIYISTENTMVVIIAKPMIARKDMQAKRRRRAMKMIR